MLWKKNKQSNSDKEDKIPYLYRFCDLYISDKYKQILFVPYGKIDNSGYAEVDNLIIDNWPCTFQELETNIEVKFCVLSPLSSL